MIYLLLAILCTVTISIVIRLSKNYVSNKMMMFVINYLVCMICSLFFLGNISSASKETFVFPIWFGILTGVLYLACFLVTELNIRFNGVALTSTFSKLGVVVPVCFAIIVYKEIPGTLKIIGLILALVAIVLMNLKLEKGEKRSFSILSILLVVLLLLGGCSDATSTIYEHSGPIELKGFYLMMIFASAMVLSIVILLIQHKRIGWKDCAFGVALGIPNYFSSFFLLTSLENLPAVVVYPTFSVASIVILSLIGVIAFKEKLKLNEIIGIGFIIGALVLINL